MSRVAPPCGAGLSEPRGVPAGRSMTLSRMIPLPESRPVLSAPPARFKSGRRTPGGVGRSPNRAFSLRSRGLRGRSKVCDFRLRNGVRPSEWTGYGRRIDRVGRFSEGATHG